MNLEKASFSRGLKNYIEDPEFAATLILRLAEKLADIDLTRADKTSVTSIIIELLKELEPLQIKMLLTFSEVTPISLPWKTGEYLNGTIYHEDKDKANTAWFDMADAVTDFSDDGSALYSFLDAQDEKWIEGLFMTAIQREQLLNFCANIAQLQINFNDQIAPNQKLLHSQLEQLRDNFVSQASTRPLNAFEREVYITNRLAARRLHMSDLKSSNPSLASQTKKELKRASGRADLESVKYVKNIHNEENRSVQSKFLGELIHCTRRHVLRVGTEDLGFADDEVFNLIEQFLEDKDKFTEKLIYTFLLAGREKEMPKLWDFLSSLENLRSLMLSEALSIRDEDYRIEVPYFVREGKSIPHYADSEEIYQKLASISAQFKFFPKIAFDMLICADLIDFKALHEEFRDILELEFSLAKGKEGLYVPPQQTGHQIFHWVDKRERERNAQPLLEVDVSASYSLPHPTSFLIPEITSLDITQNQTHATSLDGVIVSSLQPHQTFMLDSRHALQLPYLSGHSFASVEVYNLQGIALTEIQLGFNSHSQPLIVLPEGGLVHFRYTLVPNETTAFSYTKARATKRRLLDSQIPQHLSAKIINLLRREVSWDLLATDLESGLRDSPLTLRAIFAALARNSVYADQEVRPFAKPIDDRQSNSLTYPSIQASQIAEYISCYVDRKPALTCFEAATIARRVALLVYPDLEAHLLSPSVRTQLENGHFGRFHTNLWLNLPSLNFMINLTDTTPGQHRHFRQLSVLSRAKISQLSALYPGLELSELLALMQ